MISDNGDAKKVLLVIAIILLALSSIKQLKSGIFQKINKLCVKLLLSCMIVNYNYLIGDNCFEFCSSNKNQFTRINSECDDEQAETIFHFHSHRRSIVS